VRQPVPFGKYLLLDRISVGGMAEVFKAKSYGVEGFEKIIAIKRILPTMGEDRDFIKMFIDEAKIAGQLAHANICQIFELGRIDGSHFIAMEYIWGKDLLQIQNRLRKLKQPMPVPMACFVIAKVLEGLDYAHRKRDPLGRPLEIVHRDCSPQNVLVSYEGEVKVIDFGIAKATSRNSRTMAGVLKGKFGYMSPEQVRGLPLDRRSDIFALGTMLYECLTSERLFQGETDFSTLEKVRNVDIRPPREINPMIPVAVEAVIMKALAKDVEERYQWCSEMLADLQAFLMSQDVVFKAKSLSSWLKDMFAGEIDRERQQLEQYKRVGRDGLFAGVPAAEAKLDVVETLGEAGPVEGDPTVLGGPNFDDIEHAAGASPEVGPAPGSPATRTAAEAEDDSSEDFGEEAPTEIFGEINHGANPAGQPAPRAPGGPQPPLTRPPKPPPTGRAPTSRGDGAPLPGSAAAGPASGRTPSPAAGDAGLAAVPASSQPIAVGTPGAMPITPSMAAPQPTNGGPANQGRTLIGATAPAGLPSYTGGYAAPGPYPGQPPMPPGMAGSGHPGPSSHPGPSGQTPMPQLAHPSGPQMAPMMSEQGPPGSQGSPGQMWPGQGYQGQGNQGQGNQGYPGQPGQGNQGYPGQPGQGYPGQGYLGQGYPGQPGQGQPGQGYPGQGYPGQGYQGSPYPPMQQPPYGPSNQFGTAMPPVEQGQADSRKRSSIARDVAIGVAIAAIVLGGFLAVKFLFLDHDAPAVEPVAATPAFAKIRPVLAKGESASLFIDDKRHATVTDKQDTEVSPGPHKLKLVGMAGTVCERDMTLVAGKIFVLDCAPAATGGGSGSASVAPAGGSGATPGSGSAGGGGTPGSGAASEPPAAGSAPAGSAATASGSAAPQHPATDKADRMPAEDPAKPAEHVADKPVAPAPTQPADKPPAHVTEHVTEHVTDKPAAHVPDKVVRPADRPVDKIKPAEHPARPAAVEDDPLGKLQGGVKPGDKAHAKADGEGGYLTAVTRPVAQVFVDGSDTGLTTPVAGRSLPLAPGKHKVVFVYAGGKTGYTITVKPGETLQLNKELR
jgi:serine/threonine protein kinase